MNYRSLILTVFMSIGCMSNASERGPQAAAGSCNAISLAIGVALAYSTVKTALNGCWYKYNQATLSDKTRERSVSLSDRWHSSKDEDPHRYSITNAEEWRRYHEHVTENAAKYNQELRRDIDEQKKVCCSSAKSAVVLTAALGAYSIIRNIN